MKALNVCIVVHDRLQGNSAFSSRFLSDHYAVEIWQRIIIFRDKWSYITITQQYCKLHKIYAEKQKISTKSTEKKEATLHCMSCLKMEKLYVSRLGLNAERAKESKRDLPDIYFLGLNDTSLGEAKDTLLEKE